MSLPAQRHKLSRKRDQRRALLKTLTESLITHESIKTTKPKAKALRPYVEKLITKAKVDNQHNRRLVLSKISTKESLDKLFSDLGPRFKTRPGGYLRIESAGWRRGDNTEMATISFVKEDSKKPATKPATTAKSTTKTADTTKKTTAAKSTAKTATKTTTKKPAAKKASAAKKKEDK